MSETVWRTTEKIFDDATGFRFNLSLSHGARDNVPASWGAISVMPRDDEKNTIANFTVRIGERATYDALCADVFENTITADAYIREHGWRLPITIDTACADFAYKEATQNILNQLQEHMALKDMRVGGETLTSMSKFLNKELSAEALAAAQASHKRRGGRQSGGVAKGS